MDPREYLLRYFTDLDKIDIPINVRDNSFGGRLSRLGSRIGTPVRNFINSKASIPNLLTPRSITSSPVVNTLGGEVIDVASSSPKSFLGQVRGRLPQGVLRFAGLNNPIVRKAIGPVLDTTVGSVMDWGEGMSPVHAIGRNVTGTAFGIPAYIAGEGALPMVPFSGVPAYLLANQLGKEQFDRFYSGSDRDYIEPTVAAVDEFPNDYRKPPSHLIENRGPKHLETGEGPKHLETGEGPAHLSEAVDQFLTESGLRNSPAARSGVFTEEELRRQKQLHDDFKEAQRFGTMEEFVRQYPQSQTAKEYAIRRRIPSSLDMEF
tara:strand:+ start:985 stop:1941 length:957 start_codon:yes stop_codon:yes gene_type:complete